MAVHRFHPLDQIIMDMRSEIEAGAGEAVASVFGDSVKLGQFHVTPTEEARFFLGMAPQLREQLRETLGEDVYQQYLGQQLHNVSKQRGVGPVGAQALFQMLGLFEPPVGGGAAAGELTAPEVPAETGDEEPSAEGDGFPELEL